MADEIENAWRLAGTEDPFRARTLHMTILPLMTVEDRELRLRDRIRRAIDGLTLSMFDLVFDRIMTFNGKGSRRPIVLGMEGQSERLNGLAEAMRRTLALSGLATKSRRKVTPHLTMAYGKGFAEVRLLPVQVLWRVTEVALIDSVQGQGRHLVLARLPLSDD